MKNEFNQKQFLYQAVNKFIPAVRHFSFSMSMWLLQKKKKSMQTLGYFYA